MNIKELVGKKAIRTAPRQIREREEYSPLVGKLPKYDRSFMRDPIEILKVTDSHIVYRYCKDSFLDSNQKRILTNEYIDDNWTDYDELISVDETDKVSDSIIEDINNLEED